MQVIKKCSLDNFTQEPCIIIDKPSDALLQLQKEGRLVVCELKHLQKKSEAEIEEALQAEEAVWQYKHICIDAAALPEEYFERIWYRHKGEAVVIADTPHLQIRESIPKDAEAFAKLYQDAEVRKFLECPAIESVAEFERYIEAYAKNQYNFYEYGMWTVIEKASGQVIGRMGVELQEIEDVTKEQEVTQSFLALGYALLPQYRGKGYAYEACLAILKYCVACGYATEFFVKMDENNEKSNALFERLHTNGNINIKKMKK